MVNCLFDKKLKILPINIMVVMAFSYMVIKRGYFMFILKKLKKSKDKIITHKLAIDIFK